MNHPDRNIQRKAKKAFMKLVKLVVVLIILFILSALFLPVGFPEAPELASKDMAQKQYELLSKLIKSGEGIKTYTLSPADATYIANQLAEPEAAPPADGSQPPAAAPAPGAEGDAEAEKAEAPPEPGKFTFWLDDKENVTIAFSKTYYKVIPCRIEFSGKFELKTPEKTDSESANTAPQEPVLEYKISGMRFGHVPIPSFLYSQFSEMFKAMAYNKKIERCISMVTDVKIRNKDEAFIVFK